MLQTRKPREIGEGNTVILLVQLGHVRCWRADLAAMIQHLTGSVENLLLFIQCCWLLAACITAFASGISEEIELFTQAIKIKTFIKYLQSSPSFWAYRK